MNASEAATVAQSKAPSGFTVDATRARELKQGWYFPWYFDGPPPTGTKGVIVDKQTARAVVLGSAFSLDRDLRAFDEGYRFGAAFLVVKEVKDSERALSELAHLKITEVKPEFAQGEEWRIPRRLTANELKARLQSLPCKLGPISVYFAVEVLQEMRASGCMSYHLEEQTS